VLAERLGNEIGSKVKRALMKAKATWEMNDDELTSSPEIASLWCDTHEYAGRATRVRKMQTITDSLQERETAEVTHVQVVVR